MSEFRKYRVFTGFEWDQTVWEGGFTERESEEFLDDHAQYVVLVRADASPKNVASNLRSLADELENPLPSLAEKLRAAFPVAAIPPLSELLPPRTRESGKLRMYPPRGT